jgi:histone H1/5
MSYKAGIVEAITELKDRTGSSSIAIKKHMQAKMPSDKKWLNSTFVEALRKAVADGDLVQVKGSYKLSSKYKEKIAAKKAKLGNKGTAPKKKATTKKKAAPKKKATKKTETVTLEEAEKTTENITGNGDRFLEAAKNEIVAGGLKNKNKKLKPDKYKKLKPIKETALKELFATLEKPKTEQTTEEVIGNGDRMLRYLRGVSPPDAKDSLYTNLELPAKASTNMAKVDIPYASVCSAMLLAAMLVLWRKRSGSHH